jgi:glycosyltransferase involved in cell wall biosynthesis
VAVALTGARVLAGRPGRRVCLLSLSAIADDPRVRRQGDAFARVGWEVVGVGLPGARSVPPNWPILDRPVCIGGMSRRDRIAKKLKRAVAFFLVRLEPRFAEAVYWRCYEDGRRLYELASTIEAHLWLANDWSSLPIAARLVREKGGAYGYDSHEFAREEFAEQLWWRFWKRPFVCAIEGRFMGEAAVVSAVSPGVSESLDQLDQLRHPSLVIRNTPPYEQASFRPTGERIRVLYHGIVAPGRGLEAAIDSVPSWRPGFELAIRGPENPDFSAALRARIDKLRISHRVRLLPPVPMMELVRGAMTFDIGFFALPNHSQHNKFALPNKFFEYMMAGLALCVSDLPEMAGLVRKYDLGVLIPRVDPLAIADAINSLDRVKIDAFKRNALVAARELCWEQEAEAMLDAYQEAIHWLNPPAPASRSIPLTAEGL